MKYLYEGHMGNLYTTDYKLDFDKLYCEQCGDSYCLIGSFETIKDFWNLIKDACDIGGSGGWCLQYIYPVIVKEFNLPDEVRYESDYERLSGFCDHSEKEILDRIYELIKEND